jgi:putative acetyltransferase
MSKYVFRPWSPIFFELFDKERERLASHLKKALAIEHVGSTAVRDLGGKGIIDIAIAANREDVEAISQQLQTLGYEFRPSFSTPERFYLIIYLPDPEEGTRRYHIHLTFPESSEWKGLIGFRDYLRAHPEDVREYAALKQQAALESSQEGALYRKIKEPIIRKIHAMIDGDRWTVRPWQKADLEPVMDLFQQVVHTTGAKYYRPEQIQAWAPREGLDREAWLSSLEQNISYVIEIAGTITGFGDMTRAGHIERLYVHPKYQGQGMARALMKKFEEDAKALGLKTLTMDASIIAMSLLRRFGYEVVRKYTKLHRGVEFTNYFMQKKLN